MTGKLRHINGLRELVSPPTWLVVLTGCHLQFIGYFRSDGRITTLHPEIESLKYLEYEVISRRNESYCVQAFVFEGGGVVNNGTGIREYISCSCFLHQHPQGMSGSLRGTCCPLFASLILSIWHLPHGNICPIRMGMGLQEFAEECVKISEESPRNEF